MIRVFYLQNDTDKDFKLFLRSYLLDRLSEYSSRFSKLELKMLSEDIKKLNDRYRLKATIKSYFKAVQDSIQIVFYKNLIKLILNKKHSYYKMIKSIELGSYKIKKIPIIGQLFQHIHLLYKESISYYEKLKDFLLIHKELLKKEKNLYTIFKKNRRVILFHNVISV